MILQRLGKYLLPIEFNPEVESYRIEHITAEGNEIITEPSRIKAIHAHLNDVDPKYSDCIENCYRKYLENNCN